MRFLRFRFSDGNLDPALHRARRAGLGPDQMCPIRDAIESRVRRLSDHVDDRTAANNEIQTVTLAAKRGNVLKRVPIDQHEVGECSGCHDSEVIGLPHQLGIGDRCRPQNVEGRLNFSL